MTWNPFRSRDQTPRTYPAAGLTITGARDRFHRSKTAGARTAGHAAQAWEDADRQQERQRRGPYRQ